MARMKKATISRYMVSIQVRMSNPNDLPYVQAWLSKVSVNNQLPRGKRFDKYRHITGSSESKIN